MSAIFGRWNFSGEPIAPDDLEAAGPMIAPYGPDGGGSFTGPGIHIIHRAFHTTNESRREEQPVTSAAGITICWDGRLDNRKELIGRLGYEATDEATDVALVAAAYERWGVESLPKVAGDWALSIWDAKTFSLILAKDPIGLRPLYYACSERSTIWSSVLDAVVRCAGKVSGLCEEYLAGWLSSAPATHLTPYVDVHSVPPSSFVLVKPGKCVIRKYWDFDPAVTVRYATDAEYEQHFRVVFAEAVGRRLRADHPILAELSGGMDSSSIVCMADDLIALRNLDVRLDSVSYFDDSEVNWNERPHFTKVEERRRRTGCHIDLRSQDGFEFQSWKRPPGITPAPFGASLDVSKQLTEHMAAHGHRVLLSGTGGDEITGGVPTPIPELEDLLARGHFGTLARQLKTWALSKRAPWFHVLWGALRRFFPPAVVGVPTHARPVPWLTPSFVRRNRAALRGYDRAVNPFGPLPSFQEDIGSLNGLRRYLGRAVPSPSYLCEKRYPYLDRDLLAFLFAVPREQVVRPGQRRSLMRRALAGIVPDEILNRKRKAFLSRSPLRRIAACCSDTAWMNELLCSAPSAVFDRDCLRQVIERARRGEEVPAAGLIRTFEILHWMSELGGSRIAASAHGPLPVAGRGRSFAAPFPRESSASWLCNPIRKGRR